EPRLEAHHLPLRPLAAVEEEQLAVTRDQDRAHVAPHGRPARRRTQERDTHHLSFGSAWLHPRRGVCPPQPTARRTTRRPGPAWAGSRRAARGAPTRARAPERPTPARAAPCGPRHSLRPSRSGLRGPPAFRRPRRQNRP